MNIASSRFKQGWDYKWINAGIRGTEHFTVSFTHPEFRTNIIHDRNTLSAFLADEKSVSVVPREIMETALGHCPSSKMAA
jgi:hypothetical protein